MAELITLYAYNGDNLEYIGEARPGAATSNAVWRIQKLTYTGTNPTGSYWADGVNTFTKVWDNRATYTYQ